VIIALLAATLLFAGHAAMQLNDAVRAGSSLRDGLESAVIALIFLALLLMESRRRVRRG